MIGAAQTSTISVPKRPSNRRGHLRGVGGCVAIVTSKERIAYLQKMSANLTQSVRSMNAMTGRKCQNRAGYAGRENRANPERVCHCITFGRTRITTYTCAGKADVAGSLPFWSESCESGHWHPSRLLLRLRTHWFPERSRRQESRNPLRA